MIARSLPCTSLAVEPPMKVRMDDICRKGGRGRLQRLRGLNITFYYINTVEE